jgi:hypothetical protein
MAVAPRNDVLQGLLERALEDISSSAAPFWRRGILDYALVKRSREIAFIRRSRRLQAHPVIRYGVAPDWPGMSEVDDGGGSRGSLPIC